MRWTAKAVFLLLALLLFLTAGCYTVLLHPTGGNIVQEGSSYRSCADCHADAHYYHPYGHPYYRYGRSHYGWSGYYGSPWWYYDSWWWDDGHHHGHDHDHDYDAPDVEQGTRHLWSPGGWATGGWGFTKPGSSPTRPNRTGDSDASEERQEEKKEKKKEENKDDRNLWKKPKKGF